MEFLKSLFRSEPVSVVMDPTVYEIVTVNQTHKGRIVHQDEVVINLQSLEKKSIKILKQNIKQVIILN